MKAGPLTGEHGEGGGLPRAVVAQQDSDLALIQVQVQVSDSCLALVPHSEHLQERQRVAPDFRSPSLQRAPSTPLWNTRPSVWGGDHAQYRQPAHREAGGGLRGGPAASCCSPPYPRSPAPRCFGVSAGLEGP